MAQRVSTGSFAMSPAAGRLALFGGGFLFFFLLRDYAVAGGDTLNILKLDHPQMSWTEWFVFDMRYPLAHLLVLWAYRTVGDLPLAFALISCLCGGLWLVLLSLFRRSPAFWIVNFCGVVPLMFMGHKEFYAPVIVALTLYLFVLREATRPGSSVRPWHAVAAYGLAVYCHKLAVFYSPALLLLAFDPRARAWRPLPRRESLAALWALIVVVVSLQVPGWIDLTAIFQVNLTQVDNHISELLTLPQFLADPVAERSIRGAFQLFYFGSFDHFRYYLGFTVLGAPLGLIILALKRRQLFAPEQTALTVCAASSLVWTFAWHPHMGWLDWDLFTTAAVPINLQAGLLVSNSLAPCRENVRSNAS